MSIFKTSILDRVLIRAERQKVFDEMTTSNGLDGWFTNGSF